jgi:hypothetical protein
MRKVSCGALEGRSRLGMFRSSNGCRSSFHRTPGSEHPSGSCGWCERSARIGHYNPDTHRPRGRTLPSCRSSLPNARRGRSTHCKSRRSRRESPVLFSRFRCYGYRKLVALMQNKNACLKRFEAAKNPGISVFFACHRSRKNYNFSKLTAQLALLSFSGGSAQKARSRASSCSASADVLSTPAAMCS